MNYEPLDPATNQIRVITLLPECSWPGHPEFICCTLENVSLDEFSPLYRASGLLAFENGMPADIPTFGRAWKAMMLQTIPLPRGDPDQEGGSQEHESLSGHIQNTKAINDEGAISPNDKSKFSATEKTTSSENNDVRQGERNSLSNKDDLPTIPDRSMAPNESENALEALQPILGELGSIEEDGVGKLNSQALTINCTKNLPGQKTEPEGSLTTLIDKFNEIAYGEPELLLDKQYLEKAFLEIAADESKKPQVDELNFHPLWRYMWGDFAALSYVWGDSSDNETIYVNGHPMSVTKNLHSALLQLRKRLNKGLKLWVDAICINQKDIDERNLQVKRMGDIYREALKVIAWLGPAYENSKEGFNTFLGMSHLGKTSESAVKLPEFLAEMCQTRRSGPKYPYFAKMWLAIYRILCRPYWDRLWIVQEVTANIDSLIFLCGDEEAEAKEFFWAVRVTGQNASVVDQLVDSALEMEGLPPTSSGYFIRISQLEQIATQRSTTTPMLRFFQLMTISRHSQQSNERDKVYGILSMLDPNISEHVSPDYRLSVSEVFTSFTRSVITSTQRLDILRPVEGRNLRPEGGDLPSWVEDWTSRSVNSTRVLPGSYSSYSADANKPAIVSFIDSPDSSTLLSAKGIWVDAVDGVGEPYMLPDWSQDRRDIVQPIGNKSIYASDEMIRDALWRTLVGDCGSEGEPAMDIMRNILKLPRRFRPGLPKGWSDRYNHLFDFLYWSHRKWEIFGQRLSNWFEGELPSLHIDNSPLPKQHVWDAVQIMQKNLCCRKLTTTRDGRIGIVPTGAEQGDIICILLGCSTPLLVRPFDGRYKLIGECYVHGIMKGECIDQLEHGKYKLEDIMLC